MPSQLIHLETEDIKALQEISQAFPEELAKRHEGEAVSWTAFAATDILDGSRLDERLHTALEVGHYAVITGLPMPEEVPPTPERYLPTEEAVVYDFDIPQLAVSSLVGECYATKHLRGSRILADIFPKDEYDNKADSAFGSNKPFDFHGDGALHPDTKPEYFSFRAVRNEEGVPTVASWIEPGDVDSDALKLLNEPVFSLHYESTDPSAHRVDNIAIIEQNENRPSRLNYYGRGKVTVSVENPEPYIKALDDFDAALRKNSSAINLRAGEMLILNNKSAVHARQPFQPAKQPGSRRWMRRTYIATEPVKIRAILQRPDRIIQSEVDRGWYL